MSPLARQLLHLEQHLERLAFQEVPARVAYVLPELAQEREGQPVSNLIHEELAKLAGTTGETVTKVLAQFAQRLQVELGYRRLTIPR